MEKRKIVFLVALHVGQTTIVRSALCFSVASPLFLLSSPFFLARNDFQLAFVGKY